MLVTIKQQLQENVLALVKEAKASSGDVFVLGCSSSEIVGGSIGKASSPEMGQLVIETLLDVLRPKGIALVVQCCEHLNRAIVIEREVARRHGWEEVSVVPALHAGGACAVAAFQQFEDPIMIEHVVADLGMDIGDTAIGMHVRFVQVPVRPPYTKIGSAHVTALRSRPKYIGGPRAEYNTEKKG